MKFEFTGEVKVFHGFELKRIRACVTFGDVRAGELGGWIKSEKNLSATGNSWVYGNAKVYGDAEVYGNAKVYGDAEVYGGAEVYGNAKVYGGAEVLGECSKTPVFIAGLAWRITVIDNHIKIGCQYRLITEWEKLDDDAIAEMSDSAISFWKKYKGIIFSLIDARE
jgi:hypothetical protein